MHDYYIVRQARLFRRNSAVPARTVPGGRDRDSSLLARHQVSFHLVRVRGRLRARGLVSRPDRDLGQDLPRDARRHSFRSRHRHSRLPEFLQSILVL